ncbi:MAG: hypothetical protein F2923_08945 [Actinobacteria bacterium]|uniref:Unannotated protein n=1 Tax=freshwater metagenome TaxID=449393 RepID=A0A6J7SPS3_9ZZZZ|nr:hypothetical protein [Actinomycetota bacterium]
MNNKPSIGIATLATNRYAEHWKRLAKTVDLNFHASDRVTLHVMTDQVASVLEFSKSLTRIRVNAIEVEPLGWPDAPLQKFQSIVNAAHHMDQEVLMHLDADMLITDFQDTDLNTEHWINGMALVRHPGYRRAKFGLSTKNYLESPSLILRDSFRVIKEGGIGTWETSRQSTAFVPRRLRKTYVCGATWMGTHDAFLETAQILAANTQIDNTNGVIAKWHDESHLNWFASTHQCLILDSDLCFVENKKTLRDLHPKIIAVEKFDDRTR